MKPRVFISSTFYDLKQVREDIEQMVRDLGYESVRHETGAIPYSKKEALESSAYREVELCDIMVSIIGGRYGTESKEAPGSSISQQELRRALARQVQVFIFVERGVLAEYRTYLVNKGLAGIKFQAVDNVKVFEFLEQVHALPYNNPITAFDTSSEITAFLKSQWAGLFQHFLHEQERNAELDLSKEMSTTAQTLRALVDVLSTEKQGKDQLIDSIVFTDHPAFRRLAEVTKTRYRIFFTNRDEFRRWMTATGWSQITKDAWDKDSVDEWVNVARTAYLKITHQLFGADGKLKFFSQADWRNEWIQVEDVPQPEPEEPEEPELDEPEEPEPEEPQEPELEEPEEPEPEF
jgi:hypothetical protein